MCSNGGSHTSDINGRDCESHRQYGCVNRLKLLKDRQLIIKELQNYYLKKTQNQVISCETCSSLILTLLGKGGGQVSPARGPTELCSCGALGVDAFSSILRKDTSFGETVGHSRSRSSEEELPGSCVALCFFSANKGRGDPAVLFPA